MDKIAGVPVAEFLKVAEEVAKRYMALPDNPDKSDGGYLAVISKFANNNLQLFCRLGEPKCSELDRNSLGSILSTTILRRMFKHPMGCPVYPDEDHSSVCVMEMTSESEGLEIGRTIIGVVAGFDRHGNEAIALAIWKVFGWITWDGAEGRVKTSNNGMFYRLISRCADLGDRKRYTE